MSRTSVVFITRDETSGGYKVHAPGNVPGVDMAHARGANRSVYWVFHNKTDAEITVKMKFDKGLFGKGFTDFTPAAKDDGAFKTVSVPVPGKGMQQVEGKTTKTVLGWDLNFDLHIDDTVVDPGLRIDDGQALVLFVAVVSFTLGLAVGAAFL